MEKHKTSNSLRVVEFFSGIGGWSAALENVTRNCDIQFEVVAAIDINPIANAVYNHNFDRTVMAKSIESVGRKQMDDFQADIWVGLQQY